MTAKWTLLPNDRIQDERGNTIADLRYAANQMNCGNKYLIAAAPELLVALKTLLVLSIPHFSDERQRSAIEHAHAVIQKATNE